MEKLLGKAKHLVTDKVVNMKKPEASITDVGRHGMDYLAKVFVFNPYCASIPVCDITYKLMSVNRVIVSGSIPDPDSSLEGNEKTILDVKMSLIKNIGADWDIDYVLEIVLVVDLPVLGDFTIPLSHKGEIKLQSLQNITF